MPLVAHTPLPIYDDLEKLGQEVLSLDRALKQDIRELHIGLLNMMPDAALQITERQFLRLIGSSNKIVQFYVHPFTIPGLGRSVETEAYVRKYYNTFEEIQEMGLDALIVSGANPKHASLELESFWEPLQEVMAWASDNVTSVLCSCLASHAHLKFEHGIQRKRMIHKKWGVFSHRVRNRQHPLLADVNTRFDTPHSRWNEVTADDLEAAGLHILVDSDEAGVHLATSKDQFRVIYFQGHPEYLGNSLLKEYKRDLLRYLNDVSEEEPLSPTVIFLRKPLAY